MADIRANGENRITSLVRSALDMPTLSLTSTFVSAIVKAIEVDDVIGAVDVPQTCRA
jgi:hypothetical protein